MSKLFSYPVGLVVDHIDTKSLGGNHHLANRGTAGRELRCRLIPPPPPPNKLDQRPLYIGLIINKPHSKLNGNKSNINYTDVGAN